MSLVECPHCSTRVLPMAGRACPSCRKNVDAPPDPEPKVEQVVEAAYGLAAEQMRAGVDPSGIARTLTERGMNPAAAASVVHDLERARVNAEREQGQKNMLYGALWCFGGIAVTVVSMKAASGAGGGRYVLAWGAILFGGIQFFRGLFQSARR